MTGDRGGWRPALAAACLLAAMLPGAAGCGDAFIDPFDNDGRYYTVFGFLDESKNFEPGATHAVRVIPITRFPERIASPADDQASLDAVVTSTDLNTGQIHRWGHALEQLSDGAYAHVFRARFLVRRAHTYRLEVRRSDGVTAFAETTVPNVGGIEAALAAPTVDPASGAITQAITLSNVASPWDIAVIYRVGSDVSSTPYPLAYGRVGAPAGGGWRFTVNVTEDLNRLSRLLGIPASSIRFSAMGLNIRVLDGNWTPPDGVFDAEALAQPGTLSNVENGYGFWGSIGLYQHDWQISDALRSLLGF